MNLDEIHQAKMGNVESFKKIIEENKIYLYNIAISILKNEEDVGDALSETVYKAYKYLKKLKNDEYFKTWVTKILINECKKILKKRKNNVCIDEYENILFFEEKNDNEDKESVLYAINSLKNELKSVIILFYYNDLKISEIAEILNIPEGTVKSRMNTAKKQLYDILKVN